MCKLIFCSKLENVSAFPVHDCKNNVSYFIDENILAQKWPIVKKIYWLLVIFGVLCCLKKEND